MERKYFTVDVPVAGHLLSGASRSTSYALAKTGELEVMQLGRRKVVPVTWLEGQLRVGRGELDSAIDAWLSEHC